MNLYRFHIYCLIGFIFLFLTARSAWAEVKNFHAYDKSKNVASAEYFPYKLKVTDPTDKIQTMLLSYKTIDDSCQPAGLWRSNEETILAVEVKCYSWLPYYLLWSREQNNFVDMSRFPHATANSIEKIIKIEIRAGDPNILIYTDRGRDEDTEDENFIYGWTNGKLTLIERKYAEEGDMIN